MHIVEEITNRDLKLIRHVVEGRGTDAVLGGFVFAEG